MPPRLYDCVVINDELDLLELRLRVHGPHVDHVVVVEASRTFSGEAKPLHVRENLERFRPWEHLIRHVVVDDLPDPVPDRWVPEVFQRNQIIRGLHDARADDVVLIADADELVHPEVLPTLRTATAGIVGLEMPSTFFRANWRVPVGEYATAARAIRFGELEDPHRQRNAERPASIVHDAGRHFTYLIDVAAVQRKFAVYGHSERDNPRDRAAAHIARAQSLGVDLWSGDLVTVVPATALCTLERELLALRPDLFDFRALPDMRERTTFRWYSAWRARQSGTAAVPLDERYDTAPSAVRRRALQARARSVLYERPRRTARRLLRR